MKKKSEGFITIICILLMLALIAITQARGVFSEYFGLTGSERVQMKLRTLAYPVGYCDMVREELPADTEFSKNEENKNDSDLITAQITEQPKKEDTVKDGMTYLGTYWITGYDTCAQCCGKTDGITASGTQATVGVTCAATLPFGTILYIDGIGVRVVEGRGVGDGCIDVVCSDHAACYAITGWYDVWTITGE